MDCRCHELEEQMASHHPHTATTDAEIQCAIDQHDQMIQTSEESDAEEKNPWKIENEKSQVQIEMLQDEIKDLNFQLSSFIIQQATDSSVSRDHSTSRNHPDVSRFRK